MPFQITAPPDNPSINNSSILTSQMKCIRDDTYRIPIRYDLAHLFLQPESEMTHLTPAPQGPMIVPLMYVNMFPDMGLSSTLILWD